MDAAVFLGFDVWEFSVRSLFHPYGRLFLWAVMLRHPWRVWAGLLTYRNHVCPARQMHLAPVGETSETDFIATLVGGDWLVGVGFCQKPLEPPCPAGRFNHRCTLLARPDMAEPASACRACHIREIAVHALSAGATLHVMTAAVDIARDVLLPVLRGSQLNRVMLSVCPFSVAPISLSFTICGLRGLVLSYSQGDCRDYASWLRADEGTKLEQTFLPVSSHSRLLVLLDRVAAARAARGQVPARHFREVANLYVPATQTNKR
jgi:hypothetical protein